MKKLIYAMLCMIIACWPVVLSSCGNDEPDTNSSVIPNTPDDKDSEVSKGKLAGTKWWTRYEDEVLELNFNNDGTFYEYWADEVEHCKYEENGDELLVESGCLLYNILLQPCNFRIKGNTLEIYDRNYTITFTKKL